MRGLSAFLVALLVSLMSSAYDWKCHSDEDCATETGSFGLYGRANVAGCSSFNVQQGWFEDQGVRTRPTYNTTDNTCSGTAVNIDAETCYCPEHDFCLETYGGGLFGASTYGSRIVLERVKTYSDFDSSTSWLWTVILNTYTDQCDPLSGQVLDYTGEYIPSQFSAIINDDRLDFYPDEESVFGSGTTDEYDSDWDKTESAPCDNDEELRQFLSVGIGLKKNRRCAFLTWDDSLSKRRLDDGVVEKAHSFRTDSNLIAKRQDNIFTCYSNRDMSYQTGSCAMTTLSAAMSQNRNANYLVRGCRTNNGPTGSARVERENGGNIGTMTSGEQSTARELLGILMSNCVSSGKGGFVKRNGIIVRMY